MPACKLWLTKREIIKRCGISGPRLAEVLARLATKPHPDVPEVTLYLWEEVPHLNFQCLALELRARREL